MKRRTQAALAGAGAIMLAGCAVGPDHQSPAPPQGAAYAPAALPADQHVAPGRDIPGEWWGLFGSARLDALMAEGLRANPDLAAAQASLRQARELALAAEGARLPQLSANASQARERVSGAEQGRPGAASSFNLTTASLSVAYAPDVWGGAGRQLESARAQAEAERYQLEAVYLTLTGSIANAAITLAGLGEQIAATQDVLAGQRAQLSLLQKQAQLGAITRADVLAQQTAIAQTEASLPPLRKAAEQTATQLLALTGHFPNAAAPEIALADLRLPGELPLSLPSQLVAQRPDIAAAEAQWHAADAQIGVATAAQLPQFAITGQIGTAADALSTLLAASDGVWSLGGSVGQSLFDGGALEHKKRAAVAARDAAEARYRSAVVGGVADVANALSALSRDAEALSAAQSAETTARASLDLATRQYRLGATSQLAVLTAQNAWALAHLARVKAQTARFSDTTALFVALGGGWWNRQDAAPPPPSGHFYAPPFDAVHRSPKP